MKAIRINDIHQYTGLKCGGALKKEDRNLFGNPTWQNIYTRQEVRLIVDGDDTKYRDIPGVEILNGEAAIDAAILDVVGEPQERHTIQHEALAVEFIRQKGIDITDLPPDKPEEWAKCLHEKGCVGVRCRKHAIVKCADVASGLPKPGPVGRRR